jgi:hypothetical protein
MFEEVSWGIGDQPCNGSISGEAHGYYAIEKTKIFEN